MKNRIIVRELLPGKKKKSTGLVSLIALLGAAGALTAAPADITQSVTYNGETITLRLKRQTLRGAYFELKSQDATGAYTTVTPTDERSYLGTVDQYPGAVSSGVLKEDGTFRGAVFFDRGGTWFTLGTGVTGTRGLNEPPTYNFPTEQLTPGQAGNTTYRFDVGYDVTSDGYVSAGNSVAAAFEEVEYTTALLRALYMDNALLRPYLARVIVRTSAAVDPMAGLTQGDMLGAVTSEWRNNQTSAQRDLVACLGKRGGGVAYSPGFGNTWGYSAQGFEENGGSFAFLRHEMAHNFNVGHENGNSPENATINTTGNRLARINTAELDRILNSRDGWIAQFDSEGTYSDVNLPPYACMDAAVLNRNTQSNVTINVMANDHDANGHTITGINSFESTSARGGTVALIGSGASATLRYTPPANIAGNDWFHYKIVDSSGQTATGAVIVDVNPNDELAGWWKLDEAAGTTAAADTSLSATPGVIEGGATVGGTGKFGNALTFDGVDDDVKITGPTLNTNTVTIATWVKRSTTNQIAWAGIVHHVDTQPTGLHFGTANELRYTWIGNEWGWSSGLVPPADQWALVAVVIEPTKATIYLHDGTTLQSAVHTVNHAAAAFSGTTYLGWDSRFGSRRYKGLLDDARIYRRALSAAEITDLAKGGGAESPLPLNGTTGVKNGDLAWTPGNATTSHQIYLGTSQSAVAAATTASPEYRGSTAATTWVQPLAANTTYYWSVDSVTPAGTLAGPVWSFSTGSPVTGLGTNLLARWKFDAGSGTTAVDSAGGNTGTLVNGPTWTTGYSGTAVSFDGVNDVVTTTASLLNNRSAFTVAGWYKSSYTTGTVSLFGQNDVVELGLSGGKVSVWTAGGGSASSSTLPTANQWHHVTCVGDGNGVRLYVDGVLAGSGGPAANYGSSADPVRIGAGVWSSSGNPFTGQIDDVRIYSRALSAAEAAALAAGADL